MVAANEKADLELRKLRAEARKAERDAEHAGLAVKKTKIELAKAEREERSIALSNDSLRLYDFVGQVTEKSVEECIKSLASWVRDSNEQITIRFTSGGGSLIHGNALFDYIMATRASGIHVNTVTYGWAASMAAILLQAGTVRRISPNTTFMIHELRSGMWGRMSELRDDMKWNELLMKQVWERLAERSVFTPEELEERCGSHDWFMDSEECVRLGFADEISY